MSAGHLARQRSVSSHSRPTPPSQTKSYSPVVAHPFEPCAATASLFLYAQGSSILCLHHDTLAVERRFEKHSNDIQLICVDNFSERGAGRLVVSYDTAQTAIVWDLLTGQEISRFASFEQLTVAAWMRNGNVAFGSSKGEVILFEPPTSAHISARTIYDPITSIAPSADCKVYAIGYKNGSILLATLQPSFTILHTLTTQRAPSPIAALAWHASSSKQKSDMLATQTQDGDLRVWSVTKPPSSEPPRVIRALRRADGFTSRRNWISWSKNGRIVQLCDNDAWAWDVRTKHVTYEVIPTVDRVRGIAAYGPTATLFTLGHSHSVQQYDLETPQMVANKQHLPLTVPPTPPDEFQRQLGLSASESEEDLASPITRANRHVKAIESARTERAQAQAISPRSARSQTESFGSLSSAHDRYEKAGGSSRQEANSTVFSFGTQSQMSRDNLLSNGSLAYTSSAQSPVSVKSGRKGSRLKQEVLPSPEERHVQELFPYTRSRLNDVPYKPLRAFDEDVLTPDDLRRQMLSVVFGWDEDIQDLVRDELSRHPRGSQSAVLLSKWLDDDPDHMASMMGTGGTPSNLDWMMLALSGIGNQAQSKKIGETFVEKMLASGDIHAAATILASLGDYNDAIEVYVERTRYLEAILLTCLLMPQNWQRVSFLVREWGKHVVENSEQHLAIRCFSCTGVEPAGPWTSPTAQMAAKFTEEAFTSQNQAIDSFAYPRRDFQNAPTPVAMSLGPPQSAKSTPQSRIAAKNQSLKLITSFEPQQPGQFRFPGLKSDDRTPTNTIGVTPIAESAIGESAMTPGGLGSYRMNNARSLTNAMSARTATPGGYARQRLPSIGETPIDVNPPAFPIIAPKPLPTPVDSGSDKERDVTTDQKPPQGPKLADLPLLLTSARYDPSISTPARETPLTALPPRTAMKAAYVQGPPSPSEGFIDALNAESRSRNGSRGRKPDGLSLHWPPLDTAKTEVEAKQMADMAADLQRSDTAGTYIDTHSDMTSPPTTGASIRTLKSPSTSGRSIDQYISSLDEAQYYTKHHRGHRHESKDRSQGDRKRSKPRTRAPSEEDRGRRRVIPPPKRSPSSPIPMSPDDVNMYNASVESFDLSLTSRSEADSVKPERRRTKSSHGKVRSESTKTGERRRHRSSSRHVEGHKTRQSSRAMSRDPTAEPRGRGRSKAAHQSSRLGSPTSPRPMSPSGSDKPKIPDNEHALRLVANDRQRLQAKSQHRNSSRSLSRPAERGSSARRDASPDRRKASRARSSSRQAHEREREHSNRNDIYSASRYQDASADRLHHEDPYRHFASADIEFEARGLSKPQVAADRRRKEIAAAELEARRLSLARRPSAPSIPFPGQDLGVATHVKSRSTGGAHPLFRSQTEGNDVDGQYQSSTGRTFSKYSPPTSDANSPVKPSGTSRMGLPATPRAMRYPATGHPGSEDPMPDFTKSNMMLGNDFYQRDPQADLQRSMSAPIPEWGNSPPMPADPPAHPAHPAFDRRIPTSRSSSKSREGTGGRNREQSRERMRASPREIMTNGKISTTQVEMPPTLPELQHLASPPPPPPPPPPAPERSLDAPIVHDGNVITLGQPEPSPNVFANAPITAPPGQSQFNENEHQPRHRRGRSINENFTGKFRSITTRLRSSSRGRNTRSPHADEDAHMSPYESLPKNIDYASVRV